MLLYYSASRPFFPHTPCLLSDPSTRLVSPMIQPSYTYATDTAEVILIIHRHCVYSVLFTHRHTLHCCCSFPNLHRLSKNQFSYRNARLHRAAQFRSHRHPRASTRVPVLPPRPIVVPLHVLRTCLT